MDLREHFLIPPDPDDSAYRERYVADVIDGFRVLSLLVCATMTALFVGRLIQAPESRETLSFMTCGVLAAAGGMGLLVSKSMRSPRAAMAGASLLLAASVTMLTLDHLRSEAVRGSAPSLIPIIFLALMPGSVVMPLRPGRVLGLGVLLLLSCGVAVKFTNVPVRGDLLDFVSAAMAIAVAVAIAARSTRQRIRIHQSHLAAIDSERAAEGARARALLAESAVTMERLAASLSHELNTPIGALKSATETLARGVQRYAAFPPGSHMPDMVQELSGAIRESASRLSATVARIQRFANLDRSAIRLVDVNQLVQDAVALMNPPSATQAQVVLNLQPLPQIWARPHVLGVALASMLNAFIENGDAVAMDTYASGVDAVLRVTRQGEHSLWDADLGFTASGGRIRASGWDLFAARQLVRETGGDLIVERKSDTVQTVIIRLPVNAMVPSAAVAAAVR